LQKQVAELLRIQQDLLKSQAAHTSRSQHDGLTQRCESQVPPKCGQTGTGNDFQEQELHHLKQTIADLLRENEELASKKDSTTSSRHDIPLPKQSQDETQMPHRSVQFSAVESCQPPGSIANAEEFNTLKDQVDKLVWQNKELQGCLDRMGSDYASVVEGFSRTLQNMPVSRKGSGIDGGELAKQLGELRHQNELMLTIIEKAGLSQPEEEDHPPVADMDEEERKRLYDKRIRSALNRRTMVDGKRIVNFTAFRREGWTEEDEETRKKNRMRASTKVEAFDLTNLRDEDDEDDED